MSTDLVVEIPRPVINSLEDLMSAEFEHVTPLLLRAYTAHTFVQKAPPESLVGQFYQRVLSNRDERLLPPSSDVIDNLRHGFEAGNLSLAISTVTYDAIGEYILCHHDHTIVENLHRSKGGTFGQGVATKMMSKFIDTELRSFLDYRFTVMFEAGMVYMEFLKTRQSTLDKFFQTEWNAIKCLDHVKEDRDNLVTPLTLAGLYRTLVIACAGIGLVCAFIAVEIIISLHSSVIQVQKRKLAWL